MARRPFEWKEDFQRLGERVDDYVDRVFGFAPRYDLQQTWRPNVDVYRVANEISVVAELPGVDQADLRVVVEEGRVRIAGTRRPPAVGQSAEPLQLEIDSGPFARAVALPSEADADRITADFHQGLLTVRIPLRDVTRTIRVRVDEADKP